MNVSLGYIRLAVQDEMGLITLIIFSKLRRGTKSPWNFKHVLSTLTSSQKGLGT